LTALAAALRAEAALARHKRVALGISGGKDSTAAAYLLRRHWDRIRFYHADSGDLLPEVRDVVRELRDILPNLTVVRSDVAGWIAANGLPSDLVPHTAEAMGHARGEGVRLVSRYACCSASRMNPIYQRIRRDGHTLLIRGTKRADMKRLPMRSGQMLDGIELLLPLEDWSDADVMDYLRDVGAPVSTAYQHFTNLPECATCSAWWHEGRAAYLRERHPALFERYRARMAMVLEAVGPVSAAMAAELREMAR
jgi:3'-phosphoadenosine 5'-phosphosulfate sulfotransferase (PAPS reductase)/FAD synthetase